LLIEESNEFLGSAWLLKLSNCFGFDLTDTFASHFEDVSDFFEGVAVSITESVAEFDDFAFSVAERFEHRVDAISEHFLGSTDGGAFGRAVG
jgi:hypothetical protein